MKSGHRACYMSRAFALQHAFIPKDAAPGFYGFSGITNLGNWPIKVTELKRCSTTQELIWMYVQVGKKTVEQQVMLVENSYFPIILGRQVPRPPPSTPPLTHHSPQIIHGTTRSQDRSPGSDLRRVHGHGRGRPHRSRRRQGRSGRGHLHQLGSHIRRRTCVG
jgi:hypothetical protein